MRFHLRLAVTGLAAVALLGACSSSGDSTASSPSAVQSSGPALPSKQQKAFQAVLDSTRKEFGFPGVIAGVWTPDGEWVGTSGTAGGDPEQPLTRADTTRIGSLTKTFTVTALLQLAEQGKLSLDDPIEEYVPGMPNGEKATLYDLATMTSGIPSYTFNKQFVNKAFSDPEQVWQPQQLVDYAKGEKPMFAPGKEMFYSNTNTVLLGMVIEQVAGVPVAEVFSSWIFEPLNLTHTSFPAGSPDLPDPHLYGVTEQGDPEGEVKDSTFWNPSWAFTAGENLSTLDDLHTWSVALATGEGILNPDTQKERINSLVTDVPPNSPERSYGLGMFQQNGWIGHDGSIPGFTTYAMHEPDSESTIVVMVNSDIPKGKVAPAAAVFDGLAEVVD